MNPEPSCIEIFYLGIQRGQNTVVVDVDRAVNQLRQGVEMTNDVLDVSVHFSRKDGAASNVHLYGSVHTHTQEYLVLRLELLRYNNNNYYYSYHYAV